jgi:Zn finger protein HypA/HybF involved in hydrogenase expression
MHELEAVRAAVDRALEAGAAPQPGRFDVAVRIRDPRRASVDSTGFYLRELFRERGVETSAVQVTIDCARCELCEWAGIPEEADPSCPHCGMPLPNVPGAAMTIRLLPAATPVAA